MKSYRMTGIVVAVSLASLIGVVQADTANLVTNGDFTTDMTGWGVYGGAADRFTGAGAYPSAEGASAWVNGNIATWLQTKPTASLVAGQTYEVSFVARVLGAAGETNDVDKTLYTHVNDDVNGPIQHLTVLLTDTWTKYSYQFTPGTTVAGGGYGVGFLNCAGAVTDHPYGADAVGWAQFGIDNVSLHTIPEPSTLALSLAGLLGLLAYAWRKRK